MQNKKKNNTSLLTRVEIKQIILETLNKYNFDREIIKNNKNKYQISEIMIPMKNIESTFQKFNNYSLKLQDKLSKSYYKKFYNLMVYVGQSKVKNTKELKVASEKLSPYISDYIFKKIIANNIRELDFEEGKLVDVFTDKKDKTKKMSKVEFYLTEKHSILIFQKIINWLKEYENDMTQFFSSKFKDLKNLSGDDIINDSEFHDLISSIVKSLSSELKIWSEIPYGDVKRFV